MRDHAPRLDTCCELMEDPCIIPSVYLVYMPYMGPRKLILATFRIKRDVERSFIIYYLSTNISFGRGTRLFIPLSDK